jgi:hypothetical protein
VCVEVSESAHIDPRRRGVASDSAARTQRRHLAIGDSGSVTVASTHLKCLRRSNTCT